MKHEIRYYVDKLLMNNDVSIEEYSDDSYLYRLFVEIHNTTPYVMYYFDGLDEDDEIPGEFDWTKTEKNIEKLDCIKYTWKGINIYIGETWITCKAVIYNLTSSVPEELSNCIVLTKQDTANLLFVSVNSNGGFVKKLLPVKEVEIDYDVNYNEDFPHERIEEIITGDSSALILNYGIPGTGDIKLIKLF